MMGLFGKFGLQGQRTPEPGNSSGPSLGPTPQDLGNSAVPSTVGRMGGEGFWVRDYGGGVAVRPPFWPIQIFPVRGWAR